MGVFKINGTDILTLAEVVANSDTRQKSAAFSSGKLNVTGLSDSSKTLANAPSGYFWTTNIVGSKLKVNGTADTVSAKGCRPLYISQYSGNGSGTFYINKSTDGSVFLNGSSTIYIPASYDAKYIYVCFSAGAGGGGAGKENNQGGGGGGGGGSGALYIIKIDHTGIFAKIVLGSGGSAGSGSAGGTGRNSSLYYVYANGTETLLCTCNGGGGGGYSQTAGTSGGISYYTNITGIAQYVATGVGGAGGKGHTYGGTASANGSSVSYSLSGNDPENSTLSGTTSGGSRGTSDGGGGGGANRSHSTLGSGGTGGTSGGNGTQGHNRGGGGGANRGLFAGNSIGGIGGTGSFQFLY